MRSSVEVDLDLGSVGLDHLDLPRDGRFVLSFDGRGAAAADRFDGRSGRPFGVGAANLSSVSSLTVSGASGACAAYRAESTLEALDRGASPLTA